MAPIFSLLYAARDKEYVGNSNYILSFPMVKRWKIDLFKRSERHKRGERWETNAIWFIAFVLQMFYWLIYSISELIFLLQFQKNEFEKDIFHRGITNFQFFGYMDDMEFFHATLDWMQDCAADTRSSKNLNKMVCPNYSFSGNLECPHLGIIFMKFPVKLDDLSLNACVRWSTILFVK